MWKDNTEVILWWDIGERDESNKNGNKDQISLGAFEGSYCSGLLHFTFKITELCQCPGIWEHSLFWYQTSGIKWPPYWGTQEDGEWKLPLCDVMAPTLHPVGNLRHWCPKRSTVQQMPANVISYLLGCHSHQFPEIRSFHLHCHLVLTALLEQPRFDKFYYAFKASSFFTNIHFCFLHSSSFPLFVFTQWNTAGGQGTQIGASNDRTTMLKKRPKA